jgi:plastocyanin
VHGSTTKGPALEPLIVHIRNFAYVPAAPVVAVGQPIEIINDDAAAHTWSAAPGSGWTYTSGNLEKGQKASFPGFTHPGTYKFLCYYHAEMPLMNGVATARDES